MITLFIQICRSRLSIDLNSDILNNLKISSKDDEEILTFGSRFEIGHATTL